MTTEKEKISELLTLVDFMIDMLSEIKQRLQVLSEPRGWIAVDLVAVESPPHDHYNPEAVDKLVRKLIESRTMYQLQSEDPDHVIEFYSDQGLLKRMIARLPTAGQQTIKLKFGLIDGVELSDEDIATKLGKKKSTISSRVSDSIHTLREMIKLYEFHRQHDKGSDLVSLFDLDLSIQVVRRLKQMHIHSTKILLNRDEDYLMSIPKFGQRSLDEVIEKLAAHDLELKSTKE